MFRFRKAVVTAALLSLAALGSAQAVSKFDGLGRDATPKEVAAWDIDVRPDFKGLPAGSGTVAKGQDVWEAKCAQCHGTNGAGPGFDEIAGKSASELFHELIEMKYRPIEGIMDRQARGYTDDQLGLIANFLSTLPGNGDD